MTDEVKVKAKEQVTEKMVWHRPATLGVPTILFREDLASTVIAELPIPAVLADTTSASVVGEYFAFVRDNFNAPEAVIINPNPAIEGPEVNASGIRRRMQWLTAALDLCTERYEIATEIHHQVNFDRELAHAPGVKVTFYGGRWTAWDWYSALGWQSQGNTPIPQTMLNKHNSITALLGGQKVIVPFGLDSGLFDWFQEVLGLTLSGWLEQRDEKFQKLRNMGTAYKAASDPMFAHKHGITGKAVKLDPGIYEVFSDTGQSMGERTYDPATGKNVKTFEMLAGNGYTFEKVKDI